MIRAVFVVLALVLVMTGCSRHHVVERNSGRIDGARSISTSSDTDWTVQSEPTSYNQDE